MAETKEIKPAGPSVMAIFGAAGDLTKRLLIPSLYNLRKQKLVPDEFAIVGFARTALSEEEFRERMEEDVKKFVGADADTSVISWLMERLYYIKAEFHDEDGYRRLKQKLEECDKTHQTKGNYSFYLATAPEFFLEATQHINKVGLFQQCDGCWRRLVVEKPFGHDWESARQLNHDLADLLREDQIFRIDHYLGKETVQNILALRFANGIFEPIWNRRYIDHVQITVAETVGVETRGGYYDTAGALRDMVPNHILQLISLTAMEPPISFAADPVRNEQVKVLQAIRPMKAEDVSSNAVRGQYGSSSDGKMPAYRSESRVSPQSITETFVAAKLLVDNWRWADVPFYLRTGKRLPKRVTEIAIHFKRAPFSVFRQTDVDRLRRNVLVLHIQPDEGISLGFEAKIPGPVMRLGEVGLKFAYSDYFGKEARTGYETLLYDVMINDPTLFQRADMVESGWGVVTPLQKAWYGVPAPELPNYEAGSWGPQAADELLTREGRHWRKIE